MICICSPEFGLKPIYAALHETEKFFLTLFPPFIRDHIDSIDCTFGYKATLDMRSRMKGGNDV